MEENRPKIGTGVIIIKDNKVLLGQRKNSLGSGTWCFPGGHLEFGEDFETCSKRETLEETGINIKNVQFVTITNDVFKTENKHYVTVFMSADYDFGEVTLTEPDKFEKWDWFDWNNLPEPLFSPILTLIKQGFTPLNIKK